MESTLVVEGGYSDLMKSLCVVWQGRERGHWGRWRTPDGWVFEGAVVDNHFDSDNKQVGGAGESTCGTMVVAAIPTIAVLTLKDTA
jgi:hypothetical protein